MLRAAVRRRRTHRPLCSGVGRSRSWAAATLSAPGEARRVVLDGRSWSCGPDGACVARGPGASQPVLRECRRFVARFGAVTRYERDGTALTEAELVQCNAAART